MTDGNYLQQAKFFISAAKLSQLPNSDAEVAFVGRSNSGKSTALNAITNQKNLARTSKTPGRTQLINFFSLLQTDNKFLVDLPGYGFAKVPEKIKLQWQKLLSSYLESRSALRGIVLIMDVRHPLSSYDQQMLTWTDFYKLPVLILLTKADKLTHNNKNKSLFTVQDYIKKNHSIDLVKVQLFSGFAKTGVLEARTAISDLLS